MSEPLDRVLTRNLQDFDPEHPNRAPWMRSTVRKIEHASTGDVASVDLAKADRAHVHGLARREPELPEEFEDHTRASWGLPPAA